MSDTLDITALRTMVYDAQVQHSPYSLVWVISADVEYILLRHCSDIYKRVRIETWARDDKLLNIPIKWDTRSKGQLILGRKMVLKPVSSNAL